MSNLSFHLFRLLLIAALLTSTIQNSFSQQKVYWSTFLKSRNPNITLGHQDMVEAVTVDNNGDMYVVGRTNSIKPNNMIPGEYKVSSVTSSGVSFLAKLNECGVVQWMRFLGNDNLSNCTETVSCSGTNFPLKPHACSEWA